MAGNLRLIIALHLCDSIKVFFKVLKQHLNFQKMDLDYHKRSQEKRTHVGAEEKNDTSSMIVAASRREVTEPMCWICQVLGKQSHEY